MCSPCCRWWKSWTAVSPRDFGQTAHARCTCACIPLSSDGGQHVASVPITFVRSCERKSLAFIARHDVDASLYGKYHWPDSDLAILSRLQGLLSCEVVLSGLTLSFFSSKIFTMCGLNSRFIIRNRRP